MPHTDTRRNRTDPPANASPFGTVFAEYMGVAMWASGAWGRPQLMPTQPLELHPAAHALHYGSACFEGLKAHRGIDGVVRVFRLDRHADRLRNSADALLLPAPPEELFTEMVLGVVRSCLDIVPEAPGALYIRPALLGTEPNIGAATRPSNEATLVVLASPVGAYFAGEERPLTLAIETEQSRTTPRFGTVKAGANYAMALGVTARAARDLGADQVVFAPNRRVEETGASNVMLLDDSCVITPELSDAFLDGVTRDSILQVAGGLGYDVQERTVTVDDLLEFATRSTGEIALSGTAAGLAPVGHLIDGGERTRVGSGHAGPNTLRLRNVLSEIQVAARPDPHGWLTAATTT